MAQHHHHDHSHGGHGHGHSHGVHSHISSTGMYVTIFVILMVCTMLTYSVSRIDLGGMKNFVVAISIAIFKASLVILYFMHVKWSPILTKVAVVVAVVFLGILLLLTATDYSSRGWVPRQAGWEKNQVLNH
jgi:cytochrome c oxidase subunit IV